MNAVTISSALVGFTLLLTRTDTLQQLFKLAGKDLQQPVDLLILEKAGPFWHKLWTCQWCQGFHISWFSALVSILAGDYPWWSLPFLTLALYPLVMLMLNRPAKHSAPQREGTTTPARPFDAAEPREGLTDLGAMITKAKTDGGETITSVSPLYREALTFFSSQTPCLYDGCEKIRTEYEHRVALRQDPVTGECANCKKGDVMRELLPYAMEAILRHHEVRGTRFPGAQHPAQTPLSAGAAPAPQGVQR